METVAQGPELRLADLLIGLSSVTDLGMGQPVGEAARATLLAVRLAAAANLSDSDISDVFFTSLLRHIGCTAYSHESAAFFADEQSVKQATQRTDFTRPTDIFLGYLPRITRAAPRGAKLHTLRSALVNSKAVTEGYTTGACEVGSSMAQRLGLPPGVRTGLLHVFEWWNGKGSPRGVAGDDLSRAIRLATVAGLAVLFHRLGGVEGATTAIRQRSGSYLDPAFAELFCEHAPELLRELDESDTAESLRAAEPQPITVPAWRTDEVLEAFGDVVDLKAPLFHGHARAVSSLAEGAAERLGLPAGAGVDLRRAGLVCDLGRAAIPNGVWERAVGFDDNDWSQVRLHPYHSEQVLLRCRTLSQLAPIAGAHHERLDGSGYYRRAAAATLNVSSRILATADKYATMIEPRPHRPQLVPEQAAEELRGMARQGLFDIDVVDAVLTVAGHPGSHGRRAAPAGLSERQVEVLRLLAEGRSNKEIASTLQISIRTAEHHVQDIYAKLGISSRAPAALFAMEHGLVGP
ncbi:MAG: HD domain-containing phosphohydrolase, partial [Mycobacteriales bacterium]